jgi:hypothetical protein
MKFFFTERSILLKLNLRNCIPPKNLKFIPYSLQCKLVHCKSVLLILLNYAYWSLNLLNLHISRPQKNRSQTKICPKKVMNFGLLFIIYLYLYARTFKIHKNCPKKLKNGFFLLLYPK